MLAGSENKIRRNCWTERTDLEKGLMTLLVGTAILLSILGVVLIVCTGGSSIDGCQNSLSCKITGPAEFSENNSELACKTPACVESASEILNRIDTNINPCEDFYAFACNNLLPSTRLRYDQLLHDMLKKERSKIEALYIEPIMTNDHPLVKVQKRMYDACMNQTAIAEDAFRTLKEVLEKVGGWPVLEHQWNSDKFDWVQTAFKLRQLGYHHNSFLELKIVPDPENAHKYIYEISIPTVNHIYSKLFNSDDNSGFMIDVAIALGAQEHRALQEMSDVYQFLNELQWQRNSIMDEKVLFQRASVEEFQEREYGMDWLTFIYRMVGPDVTVSRNDILLFPSERGLDQWFGILMRTPPRTLANYMLWRVVEDTLPYLTDQLIHGRVSPRLMTNVECETRSEFCIHEINKRFSPSPINIMYLRKYLPKKKRDAAEEMLKNMKSALLDIIKEAKWMDTVDHKTAIQKIQELSIIVGAPGNYFNDQIFNTEIDIDIGTNNFLKLLSQANRNNLDRLYNLIDKSPQDTKIVWAGIAGGQWFLPNNEKNEIIILASMIQNPIFNEEQPNYLNYAHMVILSQYYLYELFANVESDKSKEAIGAIAECLVDSTAPENATVTDISNIYGLIAHNLGLKVSQKAYKKWAKDKEYESPLVAMDYTPEQLFWMSSGYSFCQNTVADHPDQINLDTKTVLNSMLPKMINNNPDLARAFSCAEFPEEICKLF